MKSIKFMNMFYFIFKFITFFYLFIVVSLYLFQNKLIFVGASGGKKYENVKNYEKIKLKTEDNTDIYAYALRKEGNKKAIFLFHGNNDLAGRLLSVHDEYGFDEQGFDLIALEYRGYDEIIPFDPSYETLKSDALALKELTKNYEKNVFKAHSLGSVALINLAKTNMPDAVILEAPLKNMVEASFKRFPFLPRTLIKKVLKSHFPNDELVKDMPFNKVFVAVAKSDHIIPEKNSIELFELINAKTKEIKIYDNTDHNDIINVDIDDVKNFLMEI